MSDSWAVDAYAKHRDQLLQCTIFDDLAQEVQALADQSNFERELGRFTCTTSSFCGASFKKGQLLYHCRYKCLSVKIGLTVLQHLRA